MACSTREDEGARDVATELTLPLPALPFVPVVMPMGSMFVRSINDKSVRLALECRSRSDSLRTLPQSE